MSKKEIEIFFEKHRDKCRNKIHEYFSQVVNMVKDVEIKALAEFELKAEQEAESFTKIIEEVKIVNKNIQNDIENIQNLLEMDDKSRVV